MSEIKQLSARIAAQNKWFTVLEDGIEFQDGLKGIHGVVEKPEFAIM